MPARIRPILLAVLVFVGSFPLAAEPLDIGSEVPPDLELVIETDSAYTGPLNYHGELTFRDYGVFVSWISHDTLCPAVAAHWLVEHAYGNSAGTPSFATDTTLPAHLQVDSDMYLGAGSPGIGPFDRGHMTPRGDMDSQADEYATYWTTNICPQVANFNRGQWKYLEDDVRTMTAAQTAGSADRTLVLTGPVFVAPVSTRIPTQSGSFPPTVAVPDGFFKIAFFCGDDDIIDGYLVSVWRQQTDGTYWQDTSYSTVGDIEALTGLYFVDGAATAGGSGTGGSSGDSGSKSGGGCAAGIGGHAPWLALALVSAALGVLAIRRCAARD